MAILKTLFLNPPSFTGFDGGAGARYQARREIKSFWYPTWLAQPAALVPDSKLIDAPADELSVEAVLDRVRGFDLVVMHTSTPSFTNDVKVAERLKETYPQLVIGFVGAHVAVLPEPSLNASKVIDFVGREEFDFTIKEIAEGVALEEVDGISFRKNGAIVHNKDRALITNMNTLPSVLDVYKRDLTIENYYIGYLQHPYISFYTGRGCPARCTFCLWPQTVGGHVYRTKSAETVVADMARAKQLFPQVKEYFFDDDTFTFDLPRAVKIAEGLGKLGISWSCNSRANVPYNYLKIFKDNGLRLLLVGYESGDAQILLNIKKGVSLEAARKFTQNCRDLGIVIHGTFILGLPGETKDTIEQTIRYACDLNVETIQVSLAAAYPGTELYSQAMANGWFNKDALVRNDGTQAAVLQYEGLSFAEINDSVARMYMRFYFRPRPIGRIMLAMSKDRRECARRLREGKEFLNYLWNRKKVAAPEPVAS